MLPKMIHDFKQSAGLTLRLSSLAIAIAISLFISIGFLCAALFVFVLENYGPIEACFAGACVFLLVTLVAVTCYAAMKRDAERQAAEEAAKAAAASSFLTDPAMLTVGLQLARLIGIKKLIPILALGGVALGLMSHRAEAERETDTES